MEINLDLYNAIHLPNGDILLKLKKDIDKTQYNLVLTNISFYKACEKNIGKINIYEPTNLTPLLLKIIVDESLKIKSWDKFSAKIKQIKENILSNEIIDFYMKNIMERLEYFMEKSKSKIKSTTLAYLFTKIIAQISGHYRSFGEEFFLLKLLNQYFPDIKWDYKQIYLFETRDDIDNECSEKGGRFHELVKKLCKGDKTAFDGKEIEFFPSSFEETKMSVSSEIFQCIQNDIVDDGNNYKNYEQFNKSF